MYAYMIHTSNCHITTTTNNNIIIIIINIILFTF